MNASSAIQKLLDELERLPGVGPKSAQRIAYWILNEEKADALRLANSIIEVKDTVHFCSRCFNYAQGDLCDICSSEKRDHSTVCVVSEPRDIRLHIAELMARLTDASIKEVILATNPNIEGETTASYLARLIKPLGVTVSRLASGLPVGGDLEFADEVTLGRAIESRLEL